MYREPQFKSSTIKLYSKEKKGSWGLNEQHVNLLGWNRKDAGVDQEDGPQKLTAK